MKPPTVIILWSIAMVLGIAVYFVKFHSSDTNTTHTKLAPGDNILTDLPVQEFTQITIHQGKDSTTITRGKKNQWTVDQRNHYPANHQLLRNLLGSLGDLRVTQGYSCTSANYGRFGVSSKSAEETDLGLRVTMQDEKENHIAEVFLGKYNGSTRNAMGRFIRVTGDDSGVYVVDETFPGVYADPPAWLDPQFFNIENIQSIHLTAPSDTDFTPWEVAKASPAPKDQFRLVGITDQEVMSITSTGKFRTLFSFTSFQDVLSDEEAKKTAHPDTSLKRQAVIQTFDGLTYTITYWPQQTPQTKNTSQAKQQPQASYLLTVAITAKLPTTRHKAAGESPEDAKKMDTTFLAQQQKLKSHIKLVETFHNHIYQVSHDQLTPLQKSRADFVRAK